MTKMLTDSPQAPREKTGRRNEKTMWLFLKRPFKYPVGADLSISGGVAAILKTFLNWPGFGVVGGSCTQSKYLWSEQCKKKETPLKNESLKEDLEFLKSILFFFRKHNKVLTRCRAKRPGMRVHAKSIKTFASTKKVYLKNSRGITMSLAALYITCPELRRHAHVHIAKVLGLCLLKTKAKAQA